MSWKGLNRIESASLNAGLTKEENREPPLPASGHADASSQTTHSLSPFGVGKNRLRAVANGGETARPPWIANVCF